MASGITKLKLTNLWGLWRSEINCYTCTRMAGQRTAAWFRTSPTFLLVAPLVITKLQILAKSLCLPHLLHQLSPVFNMRLPTVNTVANIDFPAVVRISIFCFVFKDAGLLHLFLVLHLVVVLIPGSGWRLVHTGCLITPGSALLLTTCQRLADWSGGGIASRGGWGAVPVLVYVDFLWQSLQWAWQR
jgi:hypothetical protein